jgi:hypothetical protein
MGNILKKKRLDRHPIIIGGVVSLLISQNILAAALFNHIVQPYVKTELTYDSNILRLPSNFTPEMSGGKTTTSSFIKQIQAGLAVNWQISQQQLLANASIDQNWYSTFNELNYTGHDLLGQWKWQIARKLKGEISYNNRLWLGSFGQVNRLASRLIKQEKFIANGAYEIFPDWYLHTEFTRASLLYPAAELQQSNLTENSREIGLRYMRYNNPFNNMLGFSTTITDGKYLNRAASSPLDNAYTRTSYDLKGKWNYSVKTQINGQIGYVSQKYQHQPARNFSAITASTDIRWDITSKSTALLSVWRKVSLNDSLVSSFTLNTGVMLTPSWTWSETPKIKVELPISYEQQESPSATGLIDTALLATSQKFRRSIVRLNLDYIPTSNIELTAFISYENGHSIDALHTYQDESAGLSVKASF